LYINIYKLDKTIFIIRHTPPQFNNSYVASENIAMSIGMKLKENDGTCILRWGKLYNARLS
jgi:hypothetical protein